MQIKEVVIKGYERMSLNSVEYFKYNPDKKIQLILGSNGSGKSSLIKELSPLPAEASEYRKSGYKHITYQHNGSTYLLKSDFTSLGNKFSFCKDGEELNPGHTVTVFKELVRKEFSITPDVHGLMTGRVKFSKMSVAERRKWFTQIADCDYTFAIGFYNKLKEQYRDIQGAVKLQQARLVQETNKLPNEQEHIKYREDIRHLNMFLDVLLSQTDQSILKAGTLSDFDTIQLKLRKAATDTVQDRNKFINPENYVGKQEILDDLLFVKSDIKSLETLLHKVYQEMDEQSKSISMLEQNNLASFQDLDVSLKSIQDEIDQLHKQLSFPIVKNPDAVSAALSSVKPQLDEYLTEMNKHANKGYTKESYQSNVQALADLNLKLNNTRFASDKLFTQLKEYDHAKQHNEVSCPNCKHTWFKGFSQSLYDECLRSREILNKDIPVLELQIKLLESVKVEQFEYLTLMSQFLKLMAQVEALDSMWKHIMSYGSLRTAPIGVRQMIQTYSQELDKQKQLNLSIDKLAELSKIKQITAENQSNDLSALKIKYAKLELSAQDYQVKIRRSKVKEQSLLKSIAIVENLDLKKQELFNLQTAHSSAVRDIEKTISQDFITSCIRLVKSELASLTQMVSRIDIQAALLTSIEKQIAEYQEQAEVYKIMLKELSPTEGLIAKGLINFINHFVIQMNAIIKKVWLYPLEIQPVFQLDDELELDYKFQVKVNDKNDISDVSLGSSAMKEVIDMAFMRVSMKYLKLDKAPLFLDEFSVNMDSAHRKSAFNTVTDLMTNSNHSQVFLISHYEDSYGSIANADVVVLCPNNVVIPKGCGYNNCVDFTEPALM
jgi:energy-coupling factor transporter ATP-binding protein EcfA2